MRASQRLCALILASGGLLAAGTTPNVAYTATGTFSPPLSGHDVLQLAGQPSSTTILASEALKPAKLNQTTAEYDGVPLVATLWSPLLASYYSFSAGGNIVLELGAAGQPDGFKFSFTLQIVGVSLQVSAHAAMPPGTITTLAIGAFTSPVALTESNATVTYADTSASTTLGLVGSFTTALQTPPPGLKTLYSFRGSPADGANPVSGLTEASDGSLFGTTEYGGSGLGTVFKLRPPAAPGGPWMQTVLYSFGGFDGAYPAAGVVLGADGVLYGTTTSGGGGVCYSFYGCGTVFSLTPPPSPGGAWMKTLLYTFTGGGDGGYPLGLVIDNNGALYGTTNGGGMSGCKGFEPGCGTAFELAPPPVPSGTWSFTVLHAFTNQNGDGGNPYAGLALGANGVLYGTTSYTPLISNGTVFQLTPPATPGGAWTETVLHNFAGPPDGQVPEGVLTIGPSGQLYGTTYSGGTGLCNNGCGTVFELKPNGAGWTESVLYSFQGGTSDGSNPVAGLCRSASGALYGTTYAGGASGYGTAFKLTPPAAAGASWTETVLTGFNTFDGENPSGGLILGTTGALYGTTEYGNFGYGDVFELKP
jgi:uncharacterized repeat protein (TIGR03803 family)